MSFDFQLQRRLWTPAEQRRNLMLGSALAFSVLFVLAFVFEGGWQLVVAVVAVVTAPVLLLVVFAYERSWPYLLILAIHVSLFGARLNVGNINVRPNMLLALVVGGLLVTNLARRSQRRMPVPLLGLFLATNAVYLLSTLIHPANPFFWKGIADCVLFFVNVLQYVIIVWFFACDRAMFEKGMRLFLYASTAFSAVYVFAFVLAQLGIEAVSRLLTRFGGENATEFTRFGNLGTTEGTYLTFSVMVLLAYGTLFRRQLPWKRTWLLVMSAANVFALALTFARGPWAAAVMGFFFVMLFAVLRYPVREVVGGAFRLIAVGVIVFSAMGWYLLAKPSVVEMFTGRIEAMSALEVGTIADRVLLWTQMWNDFENAPILGHGAHNYAKFRDDPTTQISENFVLELLHSAGIVGAGIFLSTSFWAVFRALKAVWNWQDAQNMPWLLPLVGGQVAMFLSSLTNPGITGGFYWAALGMLVSASQLAMRPTVAVAAPAN